MRNEYDFKKGKRGAILPAPFLLIGVWFLLDEVLALGKSISPGFIGSEWPQRVGVILVVEPVPAGGIQPLQLTVPPQGHRSSIERPGACGGPAGERQTVRQVNSGVILGTCPTPRSGKALLHDVQEACDPSGSLHSGHRHL
jgi:hypothetical protein